MIELNWLGITAASIIGMALGAFWYSPLAFSKAWMESIGKTPETLGSPTVPMIGSIFACLLTAFGVAILHSLIQVNELSSAISIGLVLGLLIIFPAFLSDGLFCGWSKKLVLIQFGYRAVSVFLMSLAMYFV